MFTLSNASKDLKELLKWSGIFIGILVIILLLVRLGFFIKELIYPTPPPRPMVAFGKLQPQSFPQNAVNQNFTYSIDTLTGSLPFFANQTKIYRIKPIQPDLLAVNKFEEKASNIGFLRGYTAISDKIFEWKSNPNLGNIEKYIRVNIVNEDFTITSRYKSDNDVLNAKNLPDIPDAKNIAVNMLQQMNAIEEDIDLEKTKTNLYSIQNSSLVTSTSLSSSQIIEVNLYQKDIDKLPIFYEKANSSNISILIGGGGYRGQIVGADFIHQTVSDESSTYPIISANQAFEELKNGRGYITSYFGKNTNISINNIFLAYYMGSQAQDFLMPIMVFEGNDGFFAYVSAITDEWISM